MRSIDLAFSGAAVFRVVRVGHDLLLHVIVETTSVEGRTLFRLQAAVAHAPVAKEQDALGLPVEYEFDPPIERLVSVLRGRSWP